MGNTPKERFLGMSGLARRAGKLVMGTQNVCDALAASRAVLVVMASGISAATQKRLCDRTSYYGIKLIKVPVSALDIGAALGRTMEVAAFALTDKQMADAVEDRALKLIEYSRIEEEK